MVTLGKSRSVFISYARNDGEEFATALRMRLESEQPEIPLWQDRAQMEGGVGWWRQIEDALDNSRFLVVVMTPAALESNITAKEWRYARQRGVNVYPIKGVADAEISWDELPNWMKKAHWFDIDKEWDTFVKYLKSDREPVRVPFMAPDLMDDFVERPREFDAIIDQLLDADRQDPVAITTAIHGSGGFGKTTLATAVCHDDRVMTAFDDGILWCTLGQTPDVESELTTLYAALTGDRKPGFRSQKEAVGALTEKLRVWHLATGQERQTLTGHVDQVCAVAITPNGEQAVSASTDETLKVWDLATGEERRTLIGHSGVVEAVVVTADGRRAASASRDHTVKLWDLNAGIVIAGFTGDAEMNVCAFGADADTIVAGDRLGNIHVMRLVSGPHRIG